MAIYSEFSHQKWWFPIATLNYQRVPNMCFYLHRFWTTPLMVGTCCNNPNVCSPAWVKIRFPPPVPNMAKSVVSFFGFSRESYRWSPSSPGPSDPFGLCPARWRWWASTMMARPPQDSLRSVSGQFHKSIICPSQTGWWFGTCGLFFHRLRGRYTNWLIFFRGVGIPPTSRKFFGAQNPLPFPPPPVQFVELHRRLGTSSSALIWSGTPGINGHEWDKFSWCS